MSFLSGRLAARRFILKDVHGGDHSPDAITGALNDAAFNPDQAARMKAGGLTKGWAWGDGEQVDFDAGGRPWLYNWYALFFLRIDELKIPAPVLKRRCKQLEDEWKERHDREKVPSSVKRELKLAAEDELAPKTHPTTRLIPVLWDTNSNTVYVHTFTAGALDSVRTAFRGSFSGRLEPITSLTAMEHTGWDTARRVDESAHCADTLASEFYLWLWHDTSQGCITALDDDLLGGSLENLGIECWLQERAKLSSPAGTTTLKAESLTDAEISAALLQSKAFTSIGLHLRRDEAEYRIVLQGGEIDIRSAKLPPCGGGAEDDLFYERIYFIEDLYMGVMRLYRLFLALRLNETRWGAWVAKTEAFVKAQGRAGDSG